MIFNFFNITRRRIDGDQRFDFRQVDINFSIIGSAFVCGHCFVVAAAAAAFQESLGVFITWEDRGGGTHFSAHVGDGGTLCQGQGFNAGACIFKDNALAAFYGYDFEHLQDDIHAHTVFGQFAGQVNPGHLGHGHGVHAGSHCQGNVISACTHEDSTTTTGINGMAVSANACHTGFNEVFHVGEMTDTGSGGGEDDAEFCGNRSQVLMVIRVSETGLKHTVINKVHRKGLYFRYTHCFQLKHTHGTCGILGESLINFDFDQFPGGRQCRRLNQVILEDLMCQT